MFDYFKLGTEPLLPPPPPPQPPIVPVMFTSTGGIACGAQFIEADLPGLQRFSWGDYNARMFDYNEDQNTNISVCFTIDKSRDLYQNKYMIVPKSLWCTMKAMDWEPSDMFDILDQMRKDPFDNSTFIIYQFGRAEPSSELLSKKGEYGSIALYSPAGIYFAQYKEYFSSTGKLATYYNNSLPTYLMDLYPDWLYSIQ